MFMRTLLAIVGVAFLYVPPTATATPEAVFDGQHMHWSGAGELAHRLRISSPAGTSHEFHFDAGEAIRLKLNWVDGAYLYELEPLAEPASLTRDDPGTEPQPLLEKSDAIKAASAPSYWGSFALADGQMLPGDALEEEPVPKSVHDQPVRGGDSADSRNQVIGQNLIVQGSVCVGFDCLGSESFGFDTVRLKENNLRIHFLDTSTAAGFPARSWELTANDSASGGLDYMAITDRGTNARPFWVRSNAPSHSLMVAPDGSVGMGTSVPMAGLHLVRADTPRIRFEQAGALLPIYRWDLGGNEAGFFVRDIEGGSNSPFRVQSSAEDKLLTLNKGGHVGIGLWSSETAARLDIHRSAGVEPLLRVRSGPLSSATLQMQLDHLGNLYINGTLTQLSSRHAKANFTSIDGSELLRQVSNLPIQAWNYLQQSSSVRHLGPTAEDFHAAFGLGARDTELAPSDVAGVALAAVQALNAELAERDERIASLEARLLELERHLGSQAQ